MAPSLLPWLRDDGYTVWPLAVGALLLAATGSYLLRSNVSNIPVISGTIPRLSVTLMYMTDMRAFLSKAK